MRRVVILGQTCSGKSTVASILAHRLGLQLVDLDAIHFLPGVAWTEREMDEKRRLVLQAVGGESWVIDGFSNFMKPALRGRADFIVWIDLPPRRLAPRVVTRSLRRWLLRTPVCGDNRERPLSLLTRESLLLYLLRNGQKNEAKFTAAFGELQAAGAEGLRFTSTTEAVAWAKNVVLPNGRSRQS